jgi:hypothetical protein
LAKISSAACFSFCRIIARLRAASILGCAVRADVHRHPLGVRHDAKRTIFISSDTSS